MTSTTNDRIYLLFRLVHSCCYALAACLLVASLSSQATAKETTEIGWTLRQTSLMRGDQELIACKYGVKMTPLRGGETYLFVPPYTQVQVWSMRTGKRCTIEMKDFRSQFQTAKNLFDAQRLEAVPLKKVRAGMLNCLSTVEYSETPAFQQRQVQLFTKREAPSRSAKSVCYIVSNKFNLAPNIYRCVSTFYGFPYKEAMPLSLVYYDMDHDRKTQLATGKITPSKFSQQQFAMPTGLKVVANEQKVAEAADYNEAIKMMLPGKDK